MISDPAKAWVGARTPSLRSFVTCKAGLVPLHFFSLTFLSSLFPTTTNLPTTRLVSTTDSSALLTHHQFVFVYLFYLLCLSPIL